MRLMPLIVLATLLGLSQPGSAAEPLPAPAGPAMLTLSGAIGVTNDGDKAVFDRAMLEELGVVSVTTSTPWTDGTPTFRGVQLSKVLARVAADGDTLKGVALNDYAAELPAADAETWPVLLAFEQDGKRLSLRDKGPLWIVYPRDDHPELASDVHNGKWVWQLDRIVVKE